MRLISQRQNLASTIWKRINKGSLVGLQGGAVRGEGREEEIE